MEIEVGGYYCSTMDGNVCNVTGIVKKDLKTLVYYRMFDNKGRDKLVSYFMILPNFKKWAKFRVKPKVKYDR